VWFEKLIGGTRVLYFIVLGYAGRKRLGTAAPEREIVLFVSSFELKAEKKGLPFFN